ncbi:MAG: hypothetical protein JJT88_06355 [Gammaproteobacteria bacterium]|nr:hypothetical protein [Gammaproteobacteria bacterium]
MNALAAELYRRGPWLVRVALAHVLVLLVLLALMLVDDRHLLGGSVWLKPAKFALSIAIYLLTMAWLLAELRQARPLVGLIALVVIASMCLEQATITLQAARGVQSHYNAATVFDAAVFSLMGFGIAANSVAAAVALLLFLRESDPARPAYWWGIRLGLAVFLLGSLQGAAMLVNSGHTIGGADGGPGIPLFGWSVLAGDLRIAHFIGIHAIQVLPLTGFLLDRSLQNRYWRLACITVVTVLYAGWGLLAHVAAMAGRSWFGWLPA